MDYDRLIGQMTLEEKCSLLSGKGQFYTKTVDRLNIPSMFLSDGPHGVRKQAGAADHLGLNESLPATCYPTSSAMANTWDTELAEQLGEYLGREAAAQGVNVLLGPGLNMKRSPLGGRNFEYFSEDPYLAGKFTAAYIRGIQSQGVAACPKHFAVNNQELRRMHNDSVVDERALQEIYLTGFEIAVKEGAPKTLMTAYNRINGTYANEHRRLLQDILVDQWGFDGMIVTDWGGSNDRVEGLIAGNHLEMPQTARQSDIEIADAVRDGRISQQLLDQRVKEYLRVLYDTALPEGVPDFDVEKHHAFARKAAQSTVVLLKNEGHILPLAENTAVAVIGDFAKTPRYQGSGSSMVNATRVETPLEALKASGLNVIGYEPGFQRFGSEDEGLLASAVTLAKQAEVVLVYLGLDELSESEGMDRPHMGLNGNQSTLMDALSAVHDNLVVVLCGSSAVELPWFDQCRALVHSGLGGQAGAGAAVDVLTGVVNPSGKLSETWAVSYDAVPTRDYFPGQERTTEYRESLFIGYRYYDTADIPVRFPFGYGLSYTSFSYTDLDVEADKVCFTLRNTGEKAGAEVAQLYIGKPESGLFRAKRELKGFAKVYLEPGETRRVTIPLDDKAFRYYNVATAGFEIEAGAYTLEVGASSRDIRLTGQLELEGTGAPVPYNRELLPSYYSGEITAVPDGEFEALLGRSIPERLWDRSKPLECNDTFSQLFYARGWVGRLVFRVLERKRLAAEAKGKPDLNVLFIYNMPFRAVAKMMGDVVDMAMVDGLLLIFNGHLFRGLGRTIGAWRAKGQSKKAVERKLASAGDNTPGEEVK